jgi:hypothetical protein
MPCGTGSSIVAGDLLAYDRSNKIVIPFTAALLALDVAGVAVNTPAAADTVVNVIPVADAQLVEADCTASTATAQLCIRHLMTDAATVNNTTTDATTSSAVFMAIEMVGAAANKKLRGYVLGGQSVKALV